jgi:hypothetical protein
MEEKREALVPKRLFFHMLFNRHFRQRSTVGTTVAPDSPLLDPLFLHIRLTAGRTDEHAFFIEHSTLFLHLVSSQSDRARMAQAARELQDYGNQMSSRQHFKKIAFLTAREPIITMP